MTEKLQFLSMKKRTRLLLGFLFAYFSSQSQCTIPNSFFADDTLVICTGTTTILNGPVVAGATYLWSTTEATTSININFNGKYWLQISDATCSVTDTVTVLFNSFLLSPQVSDLKLCKGGAIRPLPVQGQNLLWYTNPVGGTGSTVAPVPSTADTGRIIHWVSQTIRGCESPRISFMVKVIDKPKFDLGEAFIIPCGALGIVLQIVPDGESDYTWSNGSNETSIVAPTRGKYWLFAENMCGTHQDTVVGVECQDKCVQHPTAFTPNSDGKNDSYQPACFCPVPRYKLAIFNRNGEMVYQTTNPYAGWNGYYKGKLQPNGVYVYVTEYFDFVLKKDFSEKGTLVLFR
jgi:gliding motility-associated-like protein